MDFQKLSFYFKKCLAVISLLWLFENRRIRPFEGIYIAASMSFFWMEHILLVVFTYFHRDNLLLFIITLSFAYTSLMCVICFLSLIHNRRQIWQLVEWCQSRDRLHIDEHYKPLAVAAFGAARKTTHAILKIFLQINSVSCMFAFPASAFIGLLLAESDEPFPTAMPIHLPFLKSNGWCNFLINTVHQTLGSTVHAFMTFSYNIIVFLTIGHICGQYNLMIAIVREGASAGTLKPWLRTVIELHCDVKK